MLIDELLQARKINNIGGDYFLAMLKNELKRATKFELAPDFAVAAERLGVDFTAVSKAIPFCRAPFETTWVEVAAAARPRFSEAGIHLPMVQMAPKRVGFLISSIDKNQDRFVIHHFWNFPGRVDDAYCSWMSVIVDPTHEDREFLKKNPNIEKREFVHIESSDEWKGTPVDIRSMLTSIIIPSPCIFSPHFGADLSRAKQVELMEVGAVDWSGESMFILSTLALLNSVNTTEKQEVDLSKLNRSRVKRGVPPLETYHVLKIHTKLKQRMAQRDREEGETRDVSWHMVMGHFKVRKTGIFHWRPHARGDREHGVVTKDYEVTE